MFHLTITIERVYYDPWVLSQQSIILAASSVRRQESLFLLHSTCTILHQSMSQNLRGSAHAAYTAQELVLFQCRLQLLTCSNMSSKTFTHVQEIWGDLRVQTVSQIHGNHIVGCHTEQWQSAQNKICLHMSQGGHRYTLSDWLAGRCRTRKRATEPTVVCIFRGHRAYFVPLKVVYRVKNFGMKVPCPGTYPEMGIQWVIQQFILGSKRSYIGSENLLKRKWYGKVHQLIYIQRSMLQQQENGSSGTHTGYGLVNSRQTLGG